MPKSTITLHTLKYSKADLERAPNDDRTLFLLLTGLCNDVLMLNQTLAVIVGSEQPNASMIIKQGDSAYGMLMIRMLCGRLCEGWKIIGQYGNKLKTEYEPSMKPEDREAFKAIRKYFNPKGSRPLIWQVRDTIAFHSLSSGVQSAFNAMPEADDIGDYLHSSMGNTLYYTTELMHYHTLQNLSGQTDGVSALGAILNDTSTQTSNFNRAIGGFTLVFAERYLSDALARLPNETETVQVCNLKDLKLSFFAAL